MRSNYRVGLVVGNMAWVDIVSIITMSAKFGLGRWKLGNISRAAGQYGGTYKSKSTRSLIYQTTLYITLGGAALCFIGVPLCERGHGGAASQVQDCHCRRQEGAARRRGPVRPHHERHAQTLRRRGPEVPRRGQGSRHGQPRVHGRHRHGGPSTVSLNSVLRLG